MRTEGDELTLAGIRVGGHSIGGLETFLDLPDFKVGFDVGRCPPSAARRETLLFTHAHMDHMGGVAYHAATRALQGMRPPTYVVPRGNVADFERLFEVWRKLDRSTLEHRLIPLEPGEEWRPRPDLCVRPFANVHSVRGQGYALVALRHKLKPEFEGMSGQKLKELRGAGTEITQAHESVEVAFSGDTRIELLERQELARKARLLILEATFLDRRVSIEHARSRGHIHLDEIIARADRFENEAILLTHFSPRYGRSEILRTLDERLPEDLRARVTPLLNGFR